jgi:hypothetical protein
LEGGGAAGPLSLTDAPSPTSRHVEEQRMREPASIPDQLTTIEPDVAAFLDRHALRQPTAGGKVSSLLAAEDVHELLARRSGSHRCRVAPQLTPG